MAELIHSPEKLKKAKEELQQVIGKQNSVEEHDIDRLPYLKVVADVKLQEFTVPENAQVLVNVWATGRDPETWEKPNCFEPERFLGSGINVKGRDFELITYEAGRRICPGLPLATRMLHLMLGSLLHGFDWRLEDGILPEEMDMEEKFEISLEKAQRLRAIPVRH